MQHINDRIDTVIASYNATHHPHSSVGRNSFLFIGLLGVLFILTAILALILVVIYPLASQFYPPIKEYDGMLIGFIFLFVPVLPLSGTFGIIGCLEMPNVYRICKATKWGEVAWYDYL